MELPTTELVEGFVVIVPASTIPLATDELVVEVESPQALSLAQSVPTFKILIDAFKSR
jgi:hypothetical protein